MFSQSYDPLGYEHHLSPSPDEKRRRKERSRRRRMIEADRHRREVLEGMLRAEEAYRRRFSWEYSRRAPPLRNSRHNEPPTSSPRSGGRKSSSSVEAGGDILLLPDDAVFPPPFIYARCVSASLDEMDRDIEDHPPPPSGTTIDPGEVRAVEGRRPVPGRSIDTGSRGGDAVDVFDPELERRQAGGVGGETEPPGMDIDDDVDDDPSAPPHIIAKVVTSDDEDDDDADDLYSLWRPR
ncbi:hypothetical protein ACHAW5_010027 [Stephanodiscus triporus]|uniref:Uncharacterized protein n=1 Tax=Stephanodiscus triporus TaxID=2934178 RepID=A0ABD3N1G3_9STRA